MTELLYLVVIVAANLSAAYFGASAAIPIALLFIGFDLSLRDKLHLQYERDGRFYSLLLLIVVGGAISALINLNAAQIALASSVAFIGAGITDTVLFDALRGKSFLQRSNASNIFAAAVDSILFILIAFGDVLPMGTAVVLIVGQWAAKVIGGAFWSVAINEIRTRKERTA
jgi:hypothetical protein